MQLSFLCGFFLLAQVGTSTGAIIAVSMALLRMDLDQVESIYTKLGQKVGGSIGLHLDLPLHMGLDQVESIYTKLGQKMGARGLNLSLPRPSSPGPSGFHPCQVGLKNGCSLRGTVTAT